MADLFCAAGRAALTGLAAQRSLLAFDLDGTLAPIVVRPDDARVASATAAQLRLLATRWPVAVLTGRAINDAAPRLGFRPHYLFGNHGAERPGAATGGVLHPALDGCRQRLRASAGALRERGIALEDKGLSLALHYRSARQPSAALAWLDTLVATLDVGVQAAHGHCVLNLVPASAGDKGDALLDILRDCGAALALVIGDDRNDEPAFAKSPAPSVSVRIAPAGTPTCARFTLKLQSHVPALLNLLLRLRG